ncbi:MAG: extensin family protein [Myxococcales bacterium]|nr:extensin family protein [Myxococcales bacterium]
MQRTEPRSDASLRLTLVRYRSLGVVAFSLCLVSAAAADAPTPSAAAPPTPAAAAQPASAAVANPVVGRMANLDPNDDLIVAPPAPVDGCEAKLKAAGIKTIAAKLPVHEAGKKRKIMCGAEQVVTYLGSPAQIAYEPPPLVTCAAALALGKLDEIVVAESQRIYGKPVVRIRQIGTYACREMANYPGWVSEHSYANAIDLEAFVLKDGREVTVLRDFDAKNEAPKKKGGQLLLGIARRTYDEDLFSVVLTPHFDALHRNHFHLDLARYRTDGTRPRS